LASSFEVAAREVNFDGLVGPTHNYAGLSYGNVASVDNAKRIARPREAALQGLAKMLRLHQLGVLQAVLPPHARPDVELLRKLGFLGTDEEILSAARRESPALLACACSSSAMWTANAATVAPSADTRDRRVHFTPANLLKKLHRSIEPAATSRIFRAIFADESRFAHHDPLPGADTLGDEGAANHTRFSGDPDAPGLQLFVYGRSDLDTSRPRPKRFPARHTLEASQSIARLHRLDPDRVLFAQQSPEAIDAGVFHNDVISVGHENVFLYHRLAFVETADVIVRIRTAFERHLDRELFAFEAGEDDVTLRDAVSSYLFNSQIVTRADGTLVLIAPHEVEENARARAFVDRVIAQGPIRQVIYLDLRQSMQNGGGPACLRLRVVLTEEEVRAIRPRVMLDRALHDDLVAWVEKHHREELATSDLADPALLRESRAALDELTRILRLGPIYDFQR
jgi:succinylarginine dihydrolase